MPGRKKQRLGSAAVAHMLLQYCINIRFRFYLVPNPFGIDHHTRPELASVETPCHVDAHPLQPHFFGSCFHIIAQRL